MHTSYEQRLEFLQQFSDGLELFSEKHPHAKISQGDGWRICSSNSQFAMLNNALLYSARKEALTELCVSKTYLVRVHGHPSQDAFECDAPIGREACASGTREVDEQNGDDATTLFKVLQRLADGTSLLEAKPLTGRTNQIRIHCAYLGFAVVGDAAYANGDSVPRLTKELGEHPLCLHAWQISFAHPVSDVAVTFTAPPPEWAG
jgi:23S rRNA-/tRNA-specific pseudouridylate synthase